MKRSIVIFFFCAFPLFGESNSGELRIRVIDPGGLGVKVTIQITSKATQYRNTLTTGDQGSLDVQRLPYGIYQLEIKQPGFAEVSESVDIHSSIPTDHTVQLRLPTVNQLVTVNAANTLIQGDFCRGFPHTPMVEDRDHFKDMVPYQSFARTRPPRTASPILRRVPMRKYSANLSFNSGNLAIDFPVRISPTIDGD